MRFKIKDLSCGIKSVSKFLNLLTLILQLQLNYMQLQQRLLELFSKKVNPKIKSILAGRPRDGEAKSINLKVLDEVTSEQLLNWKTRIEQGVEKNKKLSMEFIKWVIIEYNLKSADKIDPENLDIISNVLKRLKERGVALDEDDINKKILNKK